MFLDYNLDMEKKSIWKISHPTSEASKYPFIINESGVFYAKKKFYTKRNAKNDFQILFTVSGAAEMEYEGKFWVLSEGSIVMIDCNKYHNYRTQEKAGHWTYYWVHIGGDYCSRYYDVIYKNGFYPHVIGMDSILLSCFKEVLGHIDYRKDINYICLNHAVTSILSKMTSYVNSEPQSTQDAVIETALDYIRSNYNKPLSIDELSKHLNFSKYYIIKLFNKQVGTTPYHFLIQCRVNEAKKLLRTTNCKISEIAMVVGFADTSNFSRTFTRLAGMPPARYRDNK